MAKGRLAITGNHLRRRSALLLGKETVKVDEFSVQLPREFLADRGFATGHETENDDAFHLESRCRLNHRSVTESSNSKNSGKETATHSAPMISVLPSATRPAIANDIAIR